MAGAATPETDQCSGSFWPTGDRCHCGEAVAEEGGTTKSRPRASDTFHCGDLIRARPQITNRDPTANETDGRHSGAGRFPMQRKRG